MSRDEKTRESIRILTQEAEQLPEVAIDMVLAILLKFAEK